MNNTHTGTVTVINCQFLQFASRKCRRVDVQEVSQVPQDIIMTLGEQNACNLNTEAAAETETIFELSPLVRECAETVSRLNLRIVSLISQRRVGLQYFKKGRLLSRTSYRLNQVKFKINTRCNQHAILVW